MQLSMVDLARSREIITALLDDLRLDAYLFEVEPGEDQWQVSIECAVEGGWETVRLAVAKDLLLRCATDAAVRRSLLARWREVLSACRIKPPASG